MPTTLTTQIEWTIEFDTTDQGLVVKYTPETATDFACIEISHADIRVEEFDGVIESLIRIRDEIRRVHVAKTSD